MYPGKAALMVIVSDPTQELIESVRLYVETFKPSPYPGLDAQHFMEENGFPPTHTGFLGYFKVLLEEIDVHTDVDLTDHVQEN